MWAIIITISLRTCRSIYSEESLGISTGDLVRQSAVGGTVLVEGFQAQDWRAFRTAFENRRIVHGIRCLWNVIVDVIYLDEDLCERAERNDPRILSVHGQPVKRLRFPVQHIFRDDGTWTLHRSTDS